MSSAHQKHPHIPEVPELPETFVHPLDLPSPPDPARDPPSLRDALDQQIDSKVDQAASGAGYFTRMLDRWADRLRARPERVRNRAK